MRIIEIKLRIIEIKVRNIIFHIDNEDRRTILKCCCIVLNINVDKISPITVVFFSRLWTCFYETGRRSFIYYVRKIFRETTADSWLFEPAVVRTSRLFEPFFIPRGYSLTSSTKNPSVIRTFSCSNFRLFEPISEPPRPIKLSVIRIFSFF